MPQAKELIGDIGMDNVTIHLDTYHMNIEENSMEQAVEAAGNKLGCALLPTEPPMLPTSLHVHERDVRSAHAVPRLCLLCLSHNAYTFCGCMCF